MRPFARTLLACALLLLGLSLISCLAGCGKSAGPVAGSPMGLPPEVKQIYKDWSRIQQDYCRGATFELL